MMNINSTVSNIKTIRPGDPDFIITDGLTLAARAGFEVSNDCPYEYRLIISKCIDRGWLSPIAYQHLHEDLIEKITK